jgi:hypothetical protein
VAGAREDDCLVSFVVHDPDERESTVPDDDPRLPVIERETPDRFDAAP